LPEWLLERGIGESRAVRVVDGHIVEARILIDDLTRAGTRLAARLRRAGSPATAEAEGQEYLLPRGIAEFTEGAPIVIEVTREAIPGSEPWKRPLARITDQQPSPPPLLDAEVLPFPTPTDRLGEAGWNEVLEEARSGIVRFVGGELRLSATPAMTLIDVDGYLPARELALAGAAAATRAILRLDIGGSIGLDLPTVAGKSDRQAIGEAIDGLLPRPFERTAMNGFGFIQIVRPRQRASLVEQAQDRAAFEARALLRRAAFERAGPKRLVCPPAVATVLEARPDWVEALSRQVGGVVRLRVDPLLPISAAYAENA
jgi:hypothetical protein